MSTLRIGVVIFVVKGVTAKLSTQEICKTYVSPSKLPEKKVSGLKKHYV